MIFNFGERVALINIYEWQPKTFLITTEIKKKSYQVNGINIKNEETFFNSSAFFITHDEFTDVCWVCAWVVEWWDEENFTTPQFSSSHSQELSLKLCFRIFYSTIPLWYITLTLYSFFADPSNTNSKHISLNFLFSWILINKISLLFPTHW